MEQAQQQQQITYTQAQFDNTTNNLIDKFMSEIRQVENRLTERYTTLQIQMRAQEDGHNEQMRAQEDGHNEQMRAQENRHNEQMRAQEDRYNEQMRAQENRHNEQMRAQENRHNDRMRAQENRHNDRMRAQENRHNDRMRAQEDRHKQYTTGLSARIDQLTENLLIVQAQINLRNIREPNPFEHDIDRMNDIIYRVINQHLTEVKRGVLNELMNRIEARKNEIRESDSPRFTAMLTAERDAVMQR